MPIFIKILVILGMLGVVATIIAVIITLIAAIISARRKNYRLFKRALKFLSVSVGAVVLIIILYAITRFITTPSAQISSEKPIVIEATNEIEGVSKEYEYLNQYACNGQSYQSKQSLTTAAGHYYDILEITCPDGTSETYRFQIDSFLIKE